MKRSEVGSGRPCSAALTSASSSCGNRIRLCGRFWFSVASRRGSSKPAAPLKPISASGRSSIRAPASSGA